MSSGSAQELLGRMLGKKLFVVLWHANAGAELGPVLREHLEYMIELERRGVLFASGPLSGKSGDGLSILRAATIEDFTTSSWPWPKEICLPAGCTAFSAFTRGLWASWTIVRSTIYGLTTTRRAFALR